MNNNKEKNTVKTSGKAIISLLLSIFGMISIVTIGYINIKNINANDISIIASLAIIFGVIGLLFAIILGHIARSQIKKSNGLIKGKGIALFGLIISYTPIIIIVVGLIAAIIVPKLVGNGDKARNDLTCMQMKSTANSLKMFKLDNGMYPETNEGLNILVNPNLDKYPNYASSSYLNTLPKDSWGNNFSYNKTTKGFELTSSGIDKKDSSDDIKYSTCK